MFRDGPRLGQWRCDGNKRRAVLQKPEEESAIKLADSWEPLIGGSDV